jgi:16S rRNA (adenine1518-N6/adenine1519-N6)-dimethyltransferase
MSRKLGQHFLKNPAKIRKIIDALQIEAGDFVIEIGPGHGELTKELLKHPIHIVGIEKDPKLVQKLRQNFEILNPNFKTNSKCEIQNNDVLKSLPQIPKTYHLKPETYKIAGNIPYYITGRLLRILGELPLKPKIAVLTIQKEVAERLTAKPPKMNLLAASVQIWADVKIIDFISKENFWPKPKVDAVIIKLIPYKSIPAYSLLTTYYKLARILFKQPRKTVLNNLFAAQNFKKSEILERLNEIGANPDARPQNLNIETIKKLSQILYNQQWSHE